MASAKLYYFIIYKPYGVLSQFTDEAGNPGLGSVFSIPKNVYPVGRLDLDSEGLLILTNDKKLNAKLLDPRNQHERTYWVEIDGMASEDSLKKLTSGVEINLKGKTHACLPARVRRLSEPELDKRDPDVNRIKHPKTSWLELKLIEGKNRQVRKMTAKVGHPTLRLIRVGIEDLLLSPMQPGEIRQISGNVIYRKLKILPG